MQIMYFMIIVVDFFFLLLKMYFFFFLNVYIVVKYISFVYWYVYIDIFNNFVYLLVYFVDNLYLFVGDGYIDFIVVVCVVCGKFVL